MQVIQIILSNSGNNVYAPYSDKLQRKDRVIVSTPNGLELGIVKGSVDLKEKVDLVDFVRFATLDDSKINCENCKYARSILPEIKQEADKINPEMKISYVHINHDRSKMEINYTADGRVDFRDLVKILSSKYKTKIEMHQIGNRDESKQVGAIGVCGRVTCCKAFLSDFDKVSIKMAKNQSFSLNPNRINGMCGRLLCCLKYEDEYYEEMQKKMPKIGSFVTTPDGKGVVSATDFLREKVSVTFNKDDSTEVKVYDLLDVKMNSKDKNG